MKYYFLLQFGYSFYKINAIECYCFPFHLLLGPLLHSSEIFNPPRCTMWGAFSNRCTNLFYVTWRFINIFYSSFPQPSIPDKNVTKITVHALIRRSWAGRKRFIEYRSTPACTPIETLWDNTDLLGVICVQFRSCGAGCVARETVSNELHNTNLRYNAYLLIFVTSFEGNLFFQFFY